MNAAREAVIEAGGAGRNAPCQWHLVFPARVKKTLADVS